MLPPGQYVISTPLHAFRRDAATNTYYSYSSLTLWSSARGYVNAKRTELLPTFSDLPAIILQSVRSVRISGFTIKGLANDGGVTLPSYQDLLNDDTGTPWWNTGGARDNRSIPRRLRAPTAIPATTTITMPLLPMAVQPS
jgi:hypothetical protein